MFFLCKTGIYSFTSYSFRILPLMPQKKKAKRPKREHGDAERKMKGRKNLKTIVSVVVMEASWFCVTGNLVLKLIISPALVWWNVLLVSQPMSYTCINNLCRYLSYCTETFSRVSSWKHWGCMAGISFVHHVGAAPFGFEDKMVASSAPLAKQGICITNVGKWAHHLVRSTVLLPQESWFCLRNAWSPLSSSQKNSTFWKKAGREIKSSRHQAAVPDIAGVTWFQSAMSGGI